MTFDKLSARLCGALQIAHIGSFEISAEEGLTAEEFALTEAQQVIREYKEVRANLQPEPDDSHFSMGEAKLRWLIDHAVSFGYYVAQAEAEALMLPDAARGFAASEIPYRGGAATGEKAVRNTSALYAQIAEWLQPIVDQEARQGISLARLADLVISRWPDGGFPGDGKWRPQTVAYSHETLVRDVLPKLERRGLIKRTRPKTGRRPAAARRCEPH